MVVTIEIVNFVMILKKRLANGTLSAPMQLPMTPHVASCIPKGTMKSIAVTLIQTV